MIGLTLTLVVFEFFALCRAAGRADGLTLTLVVFECETVRQVQD